MNEDNVQIKKYEKIDKGIQKKVTKSYDSGSLNKMAKLSQSRDISQETEKRKSYNQMKSGPLKRSDSSNIRTVGISKQDMKGGEPLRSFGSIKEIQWGKKTSGITLIKDSQRSMNERNTQSSIMKQTSTNSNNPIKPYNTSISSSNNINEIKRSGTFSEFANKQYEQEAYKNNAFISKKYGSTQFTSNNFGSNNFSSIVLDQNKKRKIGLEEKEKDRYKKNDSSVSQSFGPYPSFSSFKHSESSKILNFDEPSRMSLAKIRKYSGSKYEKELEEEEEFDNTEFNENNCLNPKLVSVEYGKTGEETSQKINNIIEEETFFHKQSQRKENNEHELTRNEKEEQENGNFIEYYNYNNRQHSRSDHKNNSHHKKKNNIELPKEHTLDEHNDFYTTYNSKSYEQPSYQEKNDVNKLRAMQSRKGDDFRTENGSERNNGLLKKIGSCEIKLSRLQKTLSTEICKKLSMHYATNIAMTNRKEHMEEKEKSKLYSDDKEWTYDFIEDPNFEYDKNKCFKQDRLEHTNEERNYNNAEHNIIDDNHLYVNKERNPEMYAKDQKQTYENNREKDDFREKTATVHNYDKDQFYSFMNQDVMEEPLEPSNKEIDENNRFSIHNERGDDSKRSSSNNFCGSEQEELQIEPPSMNYEFSENSLEETDSRNRNYSEESLIEQDILNESNDMFQDFDIQPNEHQMYEMIDDPNMQSLIAEAQKIEQDHMQQYNDQQEQKDLSCNSHVIYSFEDQNSSTMYNEIHDATVKKLSQAQVEFEITEGTKIEKEKGINERSGIHKVEGGGGSISKSSEINKRGRVAIRAKGVVPNSKSSIPVLKTIKKDSKQIPTNQTTNKLNRFNRTNLNSISSKVSSSANEKRKVESMAGGIQRNDNNITIKRDVKNGPLAKRNVSNISNVTQASSISRVTNASSQNTQDLKKNRNDLMRMPSNVSKHSNKNINANANLSNPSSRKIMNDSNKTRMKEIPNNRKKPLLTTTSERGETQSKNTSNMSSQHKSEVPTFNNSSGSTTAATRNISSIDTSGKGNMKSKIEIKVKNTERPKLRPIPNSNISSISQKNSNVTESCRNRKNPPLVHTNAFKRSNTTVSSCTDFNKSSISSIQRSPGITSNFVKKSEGVGIRKPGISNTNKSSLNSMNKSGGNVNSLSVKSGVNSSNNKRNMNKSVGNHILKSGTPTSVNQSQIKGKASGTLQMSDKPYMGAKEKNGSSEHRKEMIDKSNLKKMKSKNIQDMHYINNVTKDVVNEEMKRYINSKKHKARSNSIPPNNKNIKNNKSKNETKIYTSNEYNLMKLEKNAARSNKCNFLKKQNSNCNYNKLEMEKKNPTGKMPITQSMHENENQGMNSLNVSSDMVSNTENSSEVKEKKEMSYFEWLAKERKEKEVPTEKNIDEKIEIADVVNEEESISMLEPLSAFNLSQNEKKYEQNDFIVDRHPIGNGRTGLVFKAIIKNENEQVALKVMAKDTIESLNIEKQVLKEIIIQASLKHINILELLAYFEDKTRLFLILELANGGSIRNKMKLQSEPLKEEEVALYVYQIADALSYLHQFNIIHRDLKPDNILIHYSDEHTDNKIYQYGIIKLADFGFSCQLKNKRQKRSTFCGTVDYMPPEIINQVPYDCNVDLWCLGIVIFELLVGFPPFSDDTQERIFDQIKELNFHFPKSVPPSAQELILKLCSRTAEERISAEDVKSHPWIKQYI